MSSSPFAAHGALLLSIESPLLVIEVEGPVNLEMIAEYQTRTQAYREQLKHAPWASVVIFKGTPLLPLSGRDRIVETIKHAMTLNLIATAVVLKDVEYKSTTQQFWTSIYERTQLDYLFFDNVQQAKTWLLEKVKRARDLTRENLNSK